jgi:hypothetical protein
MRADYRYRVVLGYDDQQFVIPRMTFDSFKRARQHVGPAVQHALRRNRLRSVVVQRSLAPLSHSLRDEPTLGLWVTESHCGRSVIDRICAQQSTRRAFAAPDRHRKHSRQRWAYVMTAAVIAIVLVAIVLVQTGGELSPLSSAGGPQVVTAEIPENPNKVNQPSQMSSVAQPGMLLAAMAASDQVELQTSGSRVSKSTTAPGSAQR